MRMIALLCLLIAGCAANSERHSARIAVLQNPETKQTVECRVNPLGSINTKAQIENCVAAYEKAGYKVVADSAQP